MTTELIGSVVITGLSLGAVYALMSLSLTFVYGITKVFNFAQGSFFIWGSYFSYLLVQHTNLPMGLILVLNMCIMFGWGLTYERALIYPLRRFNNWSGLALIVTLGSALFLDNLALAIFGSRIKTLPPLVEGSIEISGLSIQINDILIIVILAAAIFTLIQLPHTCRNI